MKAAKKKAKARKGTPEATPVVLVVDDQLRMLLRGAVEIGSAGHWRRAEGKLSAIQSDMAAFQERIERIHIDAAATDRSTTAMVVGVMRMRDEMRAALEEMRTIAGAMGLAARA